MSDLQTDKYGISISQEIAVCRNMITRQTDLTLGHIVSGI